MQNNHRHFEEKEEESHSNKMIYPKLNQSHLVRIRSPQATQGQLDQSGTHRGEAIENKTKRSEYIAIENVNWFD